MILTVMIFHLYFHYYDLYDGDAPGNDDNDYGGDNCEFVMAKSDVIDDVSEVEDGDDYDDDGDDRDVIIMDSHCLPRGSCEQNELLPTLNHH